MMRFKLMDLPPGGEMPLLLDCQLSLPFLPDIEGNAPDVLVAGKFTVRWPEDGLYTLEGRLQAVLPLLCDACLTPLERPVDLFVNERFGPSEDFATDGQTLDLEPMLLALLSAEAPMKVLCREDCRGLCPQCGANRNTEDCGCRKELDPRLLKLREMFQAESDD